MTKPSMRIPFPGPFPAPTIFPHSAGTISGAVDAIVTFFSSPPAPLLRGVDVGGNSQTVLLTGAGISVPSGLPDYRGENGTYTRNESYKPIYFHEFVTQHESRKRYWARSFFGWPVLTKAKPNITHWAIGDLGRKGYVSAVVTQNVDSLHPSAHPDLHTIELHGSLKSVVCLSCQRLLSREVFQKSLMALNPAWTDRLAAIEASGPLETNNPDERRRRRLQVNPDGDVDLPHAPYTKFRYPACPHCLEDPPPLTDGTRPRVEIDADGAWSPSSSVGILKPAVIMFGETINPSVKGAAGEAIDDAGRLLVLGSSLATLSAWKLVERARKRGMSIGIINVGGVRNENLIFGDSAEEMTAQNYTRCNHKSELILPEVAARLPIIG